MRHLSEGETIFVELDTEDKQMPDPYLWDGVAQAPGIYALMNNANGMWYIGSSCKLRKRANEHISDLRANRHGNRHLQRAFAKYGEDTFKFLLVEYCDKSALIQREQYWIDRLKPQFNIVQIAGIVCNTEKSLNHRLALSKALKGRRVGAALLLSQKTHCPRGHEYSPENTYTQSSRGRSSRVCKCCKLARDNARYHGKKVGND